MNGPEGLPEASFVDVAAFLDVPSLFSAAESNSGFCDAVDFTSKSRIDAFVKEHAVDSTTVDSWRWRNHCGGRKQLPQRCRLRMMGKLPIYSLAGHLTPSLGTLRLALSSSSEEDYLVLLTETADSVSVKCWSLPSKQAIRQFTVPLEARDREVTALFCIARRILFCTRTRVFLFSEMGQAPQVHAYDGSICDVKMRAPSVFAAPRLLLNHGTRITVLNVFTGESETIYECGGLAEMFDGESIKAIVGIRDERWLIVHYNCLGRTELRVLDLLNNCECSYYFDGTNYKSVEQCDNDDGILHALHHDGGNVDLIKVETTGELFILSTFPVAPSIRILASVHSRLLLVSEDNKVYVCHAIDGKTERHLSTGDVQSIGNVVCNGKLLYLAFQDGRQGGVLTVNAYIASFEEVETISESVEALWFMKLGL